MEISVLENRIQDLPTLPLVAHQINIESQQDSFTAKSLGSIIEKDPSLTAKVLRLANSAYYGFSRQVSSIDRAVVLLGSNTIKNLALTISVSKVFSECEDPPIDQEGLWHHCLGCAVAAKAIVRITDSSLAENAFLGGIIHDIGIIVMLNVFPDKMVKTLEHMEVSEVSLSEAEREIFGFSHQEAGALLSEKWNFPKIYSKSIRLHHTPPPASLTRIDRENLPQYAVYAGNQIVKELGLGKSLDPRAGFIPSSFWEMLGVPYDMLPELRNAIKDEFDDMINSWEQV